MLDSGIELDLERVVQNIDEADVISIYFPLLGKSLILDTRRNEHAGPMISLVPIVADDNERYRSLLDLRPHFPCPESLSTIPWTSRIASLMRLGVWDHVVARLRSVAPDPCAFEVMAQTCLCELQELELRELLRAVSGDEYRTLWPRFGGECN